MKVAFKDCDGKGRRYADAAVQAAVGVATLDTATVPVSVLIPSMPARASLLTEALNSFHAQTQQAAEVVIRIETPPVPPGPLSPPVVTRQRRLLFEQATQPWVAPANDDDLYQPHHFETIAPFLDDSAEFVYTFGTGVDCPNVDVTGWSPEKLLDSLSRANFIPGFVTISAEALREAGGWNEEGFDHDTLRFADTGATWEDWDISVRLLRAGARFRCVPVVTWEHRHGDWEACTH